MNTVAFSPSRTDAPTDDVGLSPRELQVLRHIASGHTSQQTSRRLGISPSTVETYLIRLRTKLDAPTRAHLIRAAVRLGL
ncbi:helix-turn-helix transcriptional regulator [Streptomyces sp. S.PB5]|uniref:response regulator transcription factor n=1 Tax=Streptomyces sp. S.PB5 TaxID=3020844 RepID=UPI0025B1E048|nr:helix-turn-helix transcriptional regulator [Streptomyces sp. S.PB5]MDN3023623.1 helix-turn-helix transcriptional regulator [Streptomyces sp. S.PB5]